MARSRKRLVDGRLKLDVGDTVKISATGRKLIMSHGGPKLEPSTTGKVTRIQFDISENKFYANVRLLDTVYWMPVSGLIYYRS